MNPGVRFGTWAMFVACGGTAAAQTALPLKHAPAPTKPAITAADLQTRLYLYADDSMMGREAGTEWNLKATAYIESQVRRMGLRPGGDSGSFFQNVPLVRRAFDPASRLAIDGAALTGGTDFIGRDQGGQTRSIDGLSTVYAGAWGDSTMLPGEEAAGKVVVIGVPRVAAPGAPRWFISRQAVSRRYGAAAGIVLLTLDEMTPEVRGFFSQPSVTMKGNEAPPEAPTYLYTTKAVAEKLFGAPIDSARVGQTGKPFQGVVSFTESPAPARNVVAILPGRDAALRGQYVAIGAHNDHVGFGTQPVDHDSLRAFNAEHRRLQITSPNGRATAEQRAAIRVNVDSLRRLRPARLDSIFNGADDDGSGTVSVLEMAEQMAAARQKPRRSVIFVWHTAEELGLFGAEHFTDHPTVPRDSIVAQLNMDMVGRGGAGEEPLGGPTYIQLIGSRRLSTELGDIVETVNRAQPQPFTIDYQYDANGHPENYYCRSDHYEYARYGIPIVFFSTGGHGDYHQVTDEPQYIDYAHLARVGQWVYDVAMAVGNLDHRVVVDKPKPDPNAPCRQ
jgi:peptidase M28-like protein